MREFIRRLEAAGLVVEPTPGHYRVLRDGRPLRKASAMPFTLPFSIIRPLRGRARALDTKCLKQLAAASRKSRLTPRKEPKP